MRHISSGAVAVLAFAGLAQADTVNLQFVGTGSTRAVKVTIGASTFNTSAGQLKHAFSLGNGVTTPLNGQTKVTFCTDLTEYVSPGGATYTVAPIASLPQTVGWAAMGATRAQAVYNLFAAAGGAQNAAGANADYAAAFQIALWELVYDYNGTAGSLSLTGGNFNVKQTDGTALSGAILTDVNAFFTAVTTGPNAAQTGLLGLTNNGAQDQIVQLDVVPLPAGAAIGLAGLGMAAMVRRRMRGR
jgi:hypothetical protein